MVLLPGGLICEPLLYIMKSLINVTTKSLLTVTDLYGISFCNRCVVHSFYILLSCYSLMQHNVTLC